jgi:putative transposase
MPTPETLKAHFSPVEYYHIVCKSIDGLLLFQDNQDYKTFKERFKIFTGDFLDVWSFCLLTNHTHHIIKTKSSASIYQLIHQIPKKERTNSMKRFYEERENEIFFNKVIERQMNSFLVSYANYVNNKYERRGGVFQKPFKRIQIDGEAHLQQAIIYTNANAQKHELVKDYKNYPFSSYLPVLQNDHSWVDSKNVLEFFNGINNFIFTHNQQAAYFYQKDWPSSKLE